MANLNLNIQPDNDNDNNDIVTAVNDNDIVTAVNDNDIVTVVNDNDIVTVVNDNDIVPANSGSDNDIVPANSGSDNDIVPAVNSGIDNNNAEKTTKLTLPEKVRIYKDDQEYRINQIKKSIDISSKNKAILSLKCDKLAYKINLIQITVIFCSVLITFIETINATYNIDSIISTVFPIVLATYIGLILSIMRFFKMDDKKEQIVKILEEFSYIINKSRRIRHKIKNFHINEETVEPWENIIENYENEIYEYLLNVRESFENILHYKEIVYFKRKLLNHYVKNAFAHKNIKYVDDYWTEPHRKYEQNLSSCQKLYHWLCCAKRNKVYFDYLNHLEDLDIENKPTINNINLHNNFKRKYQL